MTPKRMTIHCSDTPNGRKTTVADIRSWHQARGWRDIGYHFVIYTDGSVNAGRPITETGAHVAGANEGNVGICVVGKDRFSQAQFQGLRTLLDTLSNRYGIGKDALFCHYEFHSAKQQGKSCPNMKAEDVRHWYFDQDEAAIEPYLAKEEG